jgi:phosphate transport system substrate-binding protein
VTVKRWSTVIVTLQLLCFLIAGCAQPVNEKQGEETWKGRITISGAWALYPLMIYWSDEFQQLYPDVRFDISAGGAGKGMADALANAVDIGMVSREIYPEEINKGAFWIAVTKDAVFLTANATNPVIEVLREKGVTREILVGIYITGEITTWGQVVGRSDITDPIHIYTRSDAAGAPATLAAYLGGAQEDLLGIGVYGDPGLLEAVVNDPLGIGYNNLNYAFDFSTGEPVTGAFVVPIDVNGNGRVDSEEAFDTKDQAQSAVANGHYPSPPARELNLVTNGKPIGLTQFFIQWILTDGQQYVEEAGYIPLAVERIEEGLNKLK